MYTLQMLYFTLFPLIGSFIVFRWFRGRSLYPLPCPPGAHWLWGHEAEAFRRASGSFYSQWISALGPTYRIKAALFEKDIVVLADPVGVAHIFKNIYNYPHSPVFRPLTERLVGRGLIWVEGKHEHQRMRRHVSPAFSVVNVKLMGPIIEETASKLQERISNDIQDQGGEVVVNILDYVSAATLDIIGKAGFSHDFQLGRSPEAKQIMNTWRKQVTAGFEMAGFIGMVVLRVFPFMGSLPLEAIKSQERTKHIIKELASKELLKNHVQEKKGDTEYEETLLSLLVQANLSEEKPIGKEELLDQIATFVVAGNETTAGSLAFTLWELAKNPEKQDRLRAELLAHSAAPTYDALHTGQLPFLDACCKEGLRLHPPSSHMERIVEQHDIIPLHFPIKNSDGTTSHSLAVEKDQVIYVPSVSLNRLSSVWGDGDVFRPERWLDGSLAKQSVKIEGWSNIFTFSTGVRNCVGQRLAIYEWKVLMAMLIHHFKFYDTGVEVIPRFSATYQPQVIGEGARLPMKITAI